MKYFLFYLAYCFLEGIEMDWIVKDWNKYLNIPVEEGIIDTNEVEWAH